MEWWWRPEIVLPVLGALGAGAAVGLEREFRGQPAGLRTHLLVCLASAFLMLMAVEQTSWMRHAPEAIVRIDPVRMAHGILTGIGFLCGGVIFRTEATVHGLTTAASLWITAALGMLFGVGMYSLAIAATLIVVVVLSALRLFDKLIPKQAVANGTIRYNRDVAPTEAELRTQLEALNIKASNLAQRLVERGELFEFSGNLRGRKWEDLDRLLILLRDDARIVEFDIRPRKPSSPLR